ncbi:T9SS type A sorting domain-containing protein [Terrimonas rubra]|uniref:T9SS type A sorting domain-containing protein n=1 Tax=Terrimonas rubra TaxID=1035890 RepID=A0ABW6A4I6_9BACT
MKTNVLFCIAILCTLLGVQLNAQTITSAGKNQLVTSNSASLLGTISGNGNNYTWSVQTSPAGAPAASFSSTTSLNPTISNLVNGTYKLRFAGNGANNYKEVYLYVTGSRGAPLINIDFGTGTTSQTLSSYLASVGNAGTTGLNYQHNGTQCPNDGFYSILPRSNGTCFSSSWIDVSDHTGNTNGRYLIVNANNQTAGTYYEQNITNLCSGNAYEFSVWIANLNRIGNTTCGSAGFALPNITFSFYDGNTLVTSKSTGSVPLVATTESDPWKRYAATVKVPNGVSQLRVVMTSNIGGCGVDFGLDDIQLTSYGPSISINIQGGTPVPGGTVFERPYTSSFSLQASAQAARLDDGTDYTYATPTYQWQRKNSTTGVWENVSGRTTLQYAVTGFNRTDTGWYRIVMANTGNIDNSNCRVISNEVYLKGPDEATLPITLGAFTVSKQNNSALLKWTTLNEKENAYFEIYRSLNGVDFERVGTVAGSGTTGLTNNYQYSDDINGLSGIIYYRLKDIDFDGNGTFSKIISLRGENNATAIAVYPNPFVGDIKVTVNSSREQLANIRLTNIAGQVLVNKQVMIQRGQNIVVLPELNRLQKGLYVVEFVSDETRVVEKILKK